LGFVFLAILTIGVGVVPQRILAQEPAGEFKPETAAPQSSAAPSESGHPSALSEEEQQNQAFRLEGPVVKWTAQTLHLSIETTADIYEVINFLIIGLAIVLPLYRFLPKYLRQRKEKLRSDLESARVASEDAKARLSAVEDKLSKIDVEIQKFRSEVEAESKQDEARIKASLAEESKRIVESAEQEISMAAAQARRGLRHFAADLAVDQAAKQMVLTPETDRALIAEFVGDVVRNGGAAGGRN
jgi:F-type H+-transporting ATPase subunit b